MWSIEEVMRFVKDADPQALAPHAELFRRHVRKPSVLLLPFTLLYFTTAYLGSEGEKVRKFLRLPCSHNFPPFYF